MKDRLRKHKSHYKRFLKGLGRNVRSFDIIKNNDYKIELLENCDIKTKQELIERERFYIENNECLNKNIPGRSYKEWRIDNKDYQKQYRIDNKDKIKEYYITNKDKINIKRIQKVDCECGGKFSFNNKSQHLRTTKHQKFIKSNN